MRYLLSYSDFASLILATNKERNRKQVQSLKFTLAFSELVGHLYEID